jgi:fatty acid desaturase
MAHHASLGDPLSDPDYIFDSGKKFQSWVGCFLFHLLQPRTWLNSMAGHLFKIKRPSWDLFYLMAWWLTLHAALWVCFGSRVCVSFFVLWMLSRASFFYLITTFREMSDHFGRPAGSVVSFTRDITIHGFGLKWIIHPHNNGYHLTHHILPSVPYYRLHLAQKEFAKLEFYAGKALRCDGYLFGKTAIVREWKTQVASGTLAPSGHTQAIKGLLNN